jgi:GGDEF domain-containing protein
LKTVASRIRDCIRPDDLIARLGGDEFAVIQTARIHLVRLIKLLNFLNFLEPSTSAGSPG